MTSALTAMPASASIPRVLGPSQGLPRSHESWDSAEPHPGTRRRRRLWSTTPANVRLCD